MVQSSLAVGGSFHSPPLSFPPGGAERHRRRRGSDKGTDPTREVTEDPEATKGRRKHRAEASDVGSGGLVGRVSRAGVPKAKRQLEEPD